MSRLHYCSKMIERLGAPPHCAADRLAACCWGWLVFLLLFQLSRAKLHRCRNQVIANLCSNLLLLVCVLEWSAGIFQASTPAVTCSASTLLTIAFAVMSTCVQGRGQQSENRLTEIRSVRASEHKCFPEPNPFFSSFDVHPNTSGFDD